MYTSEKLWLVMTILQSVCYGTLMVLVDHSSPSYRHRMEMIIAVPEWLIEWLMGNLLCAGPNSSNSSLKSRNTLKHLLDGPGCRNRNALVFIKWPKLPPHSFIYPGSYMHGPSILGASYQGPLLAGSFEGNLVAGAGRALIDYPAASTGRL